MLRFMIVLYSTESNYGKWIMKVQEVNLPQLIDSSTGISRSYVFIVVLVVVEIKQNIFVELFLFYS